MSPKRAHSVAPPGPDSQLARVERVTQAKVKIMVVSTFVVLPPMTAYVIQHKFEKKFGTLHAEIWYLSGGWLVHASCRPLYLLSPTIKFSVDGTHGACRQICPRPSALFQYHEFYSRSPVVSLNTITLEFGVQCSHFNSSHCSHLGVSPGFFGRQSVPWRLIRELEGIFFLFVSKGLFSLSCFAYDMFSSKFGQH